MRCYASAVEARGTAIFYDTLHVTHNGGAVRALCIWESAGVGFNRLFPAATALSLIALCGRRGRIKQFKQSEMRKC